MLSSELKSAKNNELQLVLANNLTISRLYTAIDTEKEKHKDEKQNLLSQLEVVKENERHPIELGYFKPEHSKKCRRFTKETSFNELFTKQFYG
ncbi:hypothetical protein B566_EDAN012013 [Ephemera danica]|nr:hypothetical protein B566_EDAN012013 [Ephemera danica]